jgi:signal peptidase II
MPPKHLDHVMNLSHKLRLVILLVVLGCTAGCDQTTKHIARRELGERGFIMLPGGFGEFRLAENPGSFLSFGDSLPKSLRYSIFTIGIGVGLVSLLAYLVFGGRFSWLVFVGLGLVWAGGMSNMIDRIARHGLVSDFIFVRVGPFHTGIFNVADVVIMIGGAVIACDLWLRRHKQAHKQAKEDQS